MDDIIQGKRACTQEELETAKEFFAGGFPADEVAPLKGYWAKVF